MEPPSLVMRPARWGWTASRGGVLKSRLRVCTESSDAERVVFGVSAPKNFLPTRHFEVVQKTERPRQLCTLENQTRCEKFDVCPPPPAMATLIRRFIVWETGFWQTIIDAPESFFRGLADDPEAAKARVLTLSAGAPGMSL